jgi:hypothetical protein
MRYRTYLIAAFATLFLIGGVSAYQKPFREFPLIESPAPEKYSALGFRIGVNYVIYAMTH